MFFSNKKLHYNRVGQQFFQYTLKEGDIFFVEKKTPYAISRVHLFFFLHK